ncbi:MULTISPECIES: restriction endonuclease subunit S [Providencia]|uniref:Restriction endonuclease subunit S n=1 Tax=Providencia huashanensis TaxID=3037798 RepID=A0ABT9AUJ6_9GAMM|nr:MULTISPECIES: restriction endonuclease subunit S [Providencia]MDO7832542.1 restriction endonuclease subunit S [Providencia sp. CRE-138-0026]MDO7858064.1 restriction endonuclease subunit S [Providencia sp. CRE-138-0111]
MERLALMPKYEAYKDSGVEWIGAIPVHWNSFPLCAKSKLKSISNNENEELLSVYLDKGVIKFDDVDAKRTNTTSSDLTKYQLVDPGDFVLNNQQAWRGSVGVSDYRGIVSPAYLVLSLSEDIVPRFGNYLFRDGAMVANYLVSSKGVGTIQRNLYWPQLKRALVFLPPTEEQLLIACFLDKKTAKIDEAISIKEKQISLLKERKQIIIQQAVTQGLDPNVPMKDSGVDWIGKIPAHWDIVPGFTVFKEGKDSNKGMIESQVLSLSYGNIIIKPEEKLVGLVPESFETYQIALPGDIIIRCTDLQNDKTSLRTGIVRNKGIITSAYLNLRLKTEHSAEFMHYFLHVLDITKTIYRFGSGLRQNLSYKDFKHMRILMPPKAEQIEIVNYINNQVEVTESSIDLIKNKIEKLKEYKTTLINSAVTGKIKITPEMVE